MEWIEWNEWSFFYYDCITINYYTRRREREITEETIERLENKNNFSTS